MSLRYDLTGVFVECCNCRIVCPCWVEDEPTEDFCAGLFAWHFASGSRIEGRDVADRTIVSVTMHGDSRRGSGSESAVYVDDRLDAATADLLITAFTGAGGGPLADLAGVTGDVVDTGRARVIAERDDEAWSIRVNTPGGATIAQAEGSPTRFDQNSEPLRLTDTALSQEMGIGSRPVVSQRTSRFVLDVAALPGPAVDYVGRSGMTGPFRYVNRDPVTEEADAQPEESADGDAHDE